MNGAVSRRPVSTCVQTVLSSLYVCVSACDFHDNSINHMQISICVVGVQDRSSSNTHFSGCRSPTDRVSGLDLAQPGHPAFSKWHAAHQAGIPGTARAVHVRGDQWCRRRTQLGRHAHRPRYVENNLKLF
jgi:hypothetical protein